MYLNQFFLNYLNFILVTHLRTIKGLFLSLIGELLKIQYFSQNKINFNTGFMQGYSKDKILIIIILKTKCF